MGSSLRIGRIFGIPIEMHFTFLLILPLFVLIFAENYTEVFGMQIGFGQLEAEVWIRYLFGTIAAVVFFATVVVHELAHSYAAIRYGVRIKSITLMLFGGVASLEEIPKKPRQELVLASAGPLTSLVIGFSSYGAMLAVMQMPIDSVAVEGITILLGLIAFYNILLAGFNVLPAFPMDGGRILRAFLASRMSHVDATRVAGKVGRAIAVAMGVWGLLWLNFFLVFVAIFVYFGAKEEEQATIIADGLDGVEVGQLMSTELHVVSPDTTLTELLDYMSSRRSTGFPVVDSGVVGIVTLADIRKVPREAIPHARVKDAMRRDFVTAESSTDAAKVLKLMSERGVDRALVMDRGNLVGVATKEDFLRTVEIQLAKRRHASSQPSSADGKTPPPPPLNPPTAYG